MDASQPEVNNNTGRRRFEVKSEGRIAFANYMLSGEKIIFTHTEVPPALEGKGLGSLLAKTALN